MMNRVKPIGKTIGEIVTHIQSMAVSVVECKESIN